ncbi:MAG: FkbM family methyltransferase, partial [Balneolales bacterium]|nr:FkbM family methyltransferase [Balneolales bacterium]
DLAALAGLRTRLRDQVATSPLCDGERFGAALSDAFRQMWHAYAEGRLKQDHIAVSAAVGSDMRPMGEELPVAGNDVSAPGNDVPASRTSSKVSDTADVATEVRPSDVSDDAFAAASEIRPEAVLEDAPGMATEIRPEFESEVETVASSDTPPADISEDASDSASKTPSADMPHDASATSLAGQGSVPVVNETNSRSTDEEIAKVARFNWKRGNHDNLLVTGQRNLIYSVPDTIEVMSTYVMLEQGQWYDVDVDFVEEFVQPGMNVLDIGAGFGAYALPAAQKVGPHGKVFAFEPVVLMRKHLDISKVENGLTGLEVIGRALGNEGGKRGLSSTSTPELTVLQTDGNDVQVVTLDSWWDFEGNPGIDVLKIDVNSKELEVLKGAERVLTEQSPVLILSTSDMSTTLVDYLAAKEFVFYDFIGGVGVLSPVEDWSQRDAYAQNVIAIKADRVAELTQQGWIHNENADVAEPELGYWKKSLQAMPWTETLFADWEKQSMVPGNKNYYRALDYICAAENLASTVDGDDANRGENLSKPNQASKLEDNSDRILRSHKATLLLVAAQELISKYNTGEGGASVAMTLIRVMNTLGKRDQAVAIMQKLMQDSKMGQDNMDVALPFLLPIHAMDSAPIRTDFAKWMMVRVVESWLLLKDLSGYLGAQTETKLREVLDGNPEWNGKTDSLDFEKSELGYANSNGRSGAQSNRSIITIGIPCYNEAKYIEQCLSSVLNQRGNVNFSLVIADNSSTDGTVQIIKSFLGRNESLKSRTKLILNPENRGPLSTFSQVYEAAESEFFMWLGAHDCLTPDFLLETLPLIENNPECSMATGIPLGINFNDRYTEINKIYRIPNASYNFTQDDGISRYIESIKMLGNCTVFHSVFRKSALQGYEFKDTPSADHIIISRLLWQGKLKYSKAGYIRRYFPQETVNQKVVSGSYTKGIKFFNHYLEDCENLIKDRYDEPRRSELLEIVNELLLQRFGNPQFEEV